MNKPIESLFDKSEQNFRLWQQPKGIISISQSDILFQSTLSIISRKTRRWKERFFVLTPKNLFYLHSEKNPRLLAVLPTAWIRVDYILQNDEDSKTNSYCFRFIKNMRFADLYTDEKANFEEWKAHFSRVFWQVDFHVKYNTLKMIGKGSFARVYMVENKETKARYAVKAFSKSHILSQSKGKESLMNEIEIMRDVKHPNIMALEELHESRNSIYLVVELLEGGELLHHMAEEITRKPENLRAISKSLLEPLAYLSEKNIMHRDVKPDNIIFKSKANLDFDQIKLVDFGLASYCDMTNQLFKRCGTPGFVAPEIVRASSSSSESGVTYDWKCDVFSAGIIIYTILVEKAPFRGKSFREILEKNKKCKIDFDDPKIKANKLARDLLQKLLEIDPEKRISARQALQHEYFSEINAINKVEEETLEEKLQRIENMRIYIENYKSKEHIKENQAEVSSLIMREGAITGNTDTIDSFNSQGAISSFKNMGSPKKPESAKKRESILKMVLLQNAQHINEDFYIQTFIEESFSFDDEEAEEIVKLRSEEELVILKSL